MAHSVNIENGLISSPVTRKQLGEQTGLNGKELTAHIKNLRDGGGVISRLAFVSPASGPQRQRCYCFVATQQSLIPGAEQ